jgi:hypothetical protein
MLPGRRAAAGVLPGGVARRAGGAGGLHQRTRQEEPTVPLLQDAFRPTGRDTRNPPPPHFFNAVFRLYNDFLVAG